MKDHTLFVDTSAWFAFLNRKDPHHPQVSHTLRTFKGRLLTSNFIFDETITLCLYRQGHALAARVGEVMLNYQVVQLIHITQEDSQLAWQLFLKRPDQQYSYTDCTSFVVMRRLNIHTALTLDIDFQKEGFTCLPGG